MSSICILCPQNNLSEFCLSRNGLKKKKKTPCLWKDYSFEDKERKTQSHKCIGVVRHQKSTFWSSKSLWKTTRPRRSHFPNKAALTARWEHNIWSFSKGKNSRDYSASWLPRISMLPNVANSSWESERMTLKLLRIQLYSVSAPVLQKREKSTNSGFLQS